MAYLKFLISAYMLLCLSMASATCFDVELRGAYFYPANSLVREIYRDDRFSIDAEVSKPLDQNWAVWANFGYISARGSTEWKNRSELKLYPLSAGIKYTYPVCQNFSLYGGVGPNYVWMDLKNHGNILRKHHKKSCWGATFKTGAYVEVTERIFLDAFADYLFVPMHLKNAYNVGGFRFGLGVGMHI